MVIAATAASAADGAERVTVEYEPLPSVTATPDAAHAGAPRLWDGAASNVCVDSLAGDAESAVGHTLSESHFVAMFPALARARLELRRADWAGVQH